jgi:heme-degrading monooxygenase HmoA
MTTYPTSSIAVIFISQRNGNDAKGYRLASEDMIVLAAQQPGYLGVDSVRDDAGLGITVSYWQNEAAASAWRDNAEHTAIRNAGRGKWYDSYSLHVANIGRSYDWLREIG